MSPAEPEAARTGPCFGLFALRSGEGQDDFASLHAAVTNDWGPRDAYERRWVLELVAAMWRQDRLRGLELAALDAAATESPPSEATLKRLLGFARYGARIDKDIGAALRALRVLRDRPDAWIAAMPACTAEPEPPASAAACTREPEPTGRPLPIAPSFTRTREPEAAAPQTPPNRHERRRLEALQRQAGRRAA